MRYNRYTADSPLVSEIGLGAWQLGVDSGWLSMSEQEAIAIVQESLNLGINFFDTAPNYGYGTSETRLGNALKTIDRSRIVINTKFGHTHAGDINFSADYIRTSLEGSLRRLQTDYVDSLIIHNPPFDHLDGNRNAHYEILERLIEEGKIRAYGASLDTNEEMQLFMKTTNGKVIEAFFNIFHQDAAKAFETAKEKEVGIIVKIPLDSGWLTGKYHADSTFSDIRDRWSRQDIETRAHLVAKVRRLLPVDSDITQTAIAFCLAYDAVSTVIPGNKTPAQLRSNVESINMPLSGTLVQMLEQFYRSDVEALNLPW
jgi:aryl-alcohol dehydrogenase-like predicted oxidoreductase